MVEGSLRRFYCSQAQTPRVRRPQKDGGVGDLEMGGQGTGHRRGHGHRRVLPLRSDWAPAEAWRRGPPAVRSQAESESAEGRSASRKRFARARARAHRHVTRCLSRAPPAQPVYGGHEAVQESMLYARVRASRDVSPARGRGGDVLSPDRTIPRSSELCGTGTSTAAWISSAMCFGRSERAGRGRRGKEPRIINSSLGKPRGHESLLAPPCHPPVPRHAAHSSARYHAPSAPVFVR